MKKFVLPAMLAICLLLSACGKANAVKNAYEDFSKELSACDEFSFTAAVRAEYEHKTARFTLSYTEDDVGGTVTVIAPELISGISARVLKNSTRLEYGDVSLDVGTLDKHGLSPMSSLPALVSALKSGHLDSFWTEDGKTVLQLIPNDDLLCTVWFSDSMTPLRAEIQSDGRVVIFAEISDWKVS